MGGRVIKAGRESTTPPLVSGRASGLAVGRRMWRCLLAAAAAAAAAPRRSRGLGEDAFACPPCRLPPSAISAAQRPPHGRPGARPAQLRPLPWTSRCGCGCGRGCGRWSCAWRPVRHVARRRHVEPQSLLGRGIVAVDCTPAAVLRAPKAAQYGPCARQATHTPSTRYPPTTHTYAPGTRCCNVPSSLSEMRLCTPAALPCLSLSTANPALPITLPP